LRLRSYEQFHAYAQGVLLLCRRCRGVVKTVWRGIRGVAGDQAMAAAAVPAAVVGKARAFMNMGAASEQETDQNQGCLHNDNLKNVYGFDSPSLALVARIVELISYKPGWQFKVSPISNYDQVEVRIVHMTRDAAGHLEGDIPIVCKHVFNNEAISVAHAAGKLTLMVTMSLRDTIRMFELHELDEWLKIDGEYVKDPHAESRI
jgi:hypothetical protein